MNIISKELLSEVLGVNCTQIEIPIEGHNLIGFEIDNKDYMHTINIHELAFKVKKWANEQGYSIFSGKSNQMSHSGSAEAYVLDVGHIHKELLDKHLLLISTCQTEPEAIFKAGEWILENR